MFMAIKESALYELKSVFHLCDTALMSEEKFTQNSCAFKLTWGIAYA